MVNRARSRYKCVAMTDRITIALAQLNPVMGDIPGNIEKLRRARLEAASKGADLVLTGEGRLDRQTLLGKTPAGVARHGRQHGATVICLAGSLGDGYEALYEETGVTAAFSVVSGPMTLDQACQIAASLLRERARDCMRLWLDGQRAPQD